MATSSSVDGGGGITTFFVLDGDYTAILAAIGEEGLRAAVVQALVSAGITNAAHFRYLFRAGSIVVSVTAPEAAATQIDNAVSNGNVLVMVNNQALKAQSQAVDEPVDSSSDDDLSSGAIAGIAVGAVVALALVILVVMRVTSSNDRGSSEIDEAASPQVIVSDMDGYVFDVDTAMSDHTAVWDSEQPGLYLDHSKTVGDPHMGTTEI